MSERLFYQHPVDLATIMQDRIEGLLLGIGSIFLEKIDRFISLGATPIVNDQDKPFFIVDYGFVFYVLIEWIKQIDNNIATNIENDYTKENVYLTKNGLFFLSILEYFNVSYRNRNVKTFYIKNLFFENNQKSFFIVNSIAINKTAFDQYCGDSFTKNIEKGCEAFHIDGLAYGVNVYRYLAREKTKRKKQIDVVNFWTNTGINKLLFQDGKSE